MNKLLLLYCHPWPHKSRYNRRLFETARHIPGLAARDLYELYPSLHVDELGEQSALEAADVVVFQFPIYWFSAPALMKEWMDVVLKAGFAYGDDGSALAGKRALFAVSTGGDEASYAQGSKHGAEIEAFLLPFEMTVKFCGMVVEKPFVSFNVRDLSHETIKERARAYADRLSALAGGGKG